MVVLSFALSFVVHIETSKNHEKINNLIVDIQKYRTSIKEFNRKYGFLPGDLKKTQIFDLSKKNTDGNENGLIEDLNQQQGIYYRNIQANGELVNFWLHLYNSGFLEKKSKIFPYVKFLNSGILLFTNGEENFFHLGVIGINEINEIETNYNLTPYHAYMIDKKIDDSLPIDGDVFISWGKKINLDNIRKSYKNCATDFEYLSVFKRKVCQLVIKL